MTSPDTRNVSSSLNRDALLSQVCWLISQASTSEAFTSAMSRACDALGADAYVLGQVQRIGNEYAVRMFHNLSPEELKLCRSSAGAAIDPLMRHLITSHLPIYWDRQTFVDADQLAMWQESADVAQHTHGIAAPIHISPDVMVYLAMDWCDAAPLASADRAWTLMALQTCAISAQASATRIWRMQDLASSPQVQYLLTKRQTDCLLWASRGMTDAAIGKILAITARTARKHIEDVIALFGAASRTEAAAMAIRLGLLEATDAPSIQGVMPVGAYGEPLEPVQQSTRRQTVAGHAGRCLSAGTTRVRPKQGQPPPKTRGGGKATSS